MDSRTEEIVNRFRNSWTETQLFYDNLIKKYSAFDRLIPLLQFIQKLNDKGESAYFRLGTSLHYLIISRSVDHGLRDDQKRIRIKAIDTDDFEVGLFDGYNCYREFRIRDFEDNRLTKLLGTFKDTLVD